MIILDHIFRYISLRRLERFWENAKQYITDRIAEIVQPAGDKEIVNVLTYGSQAPGIAEDGELYINSVDNTLYVYEEGSWAEVEASESVIYVTSDTAHIYVYSHGVFVDSTGESVDNTIYVNNLTTDLAGYTEQGLYSVCMVEGGTQRFYTMTVNMSRRNLPGRPPRVITYYLQMLHNNDGYMSRTKVGTGDWGDWNEFLYAFTKDIEELLPLIYAGL